MAWEVRSPSDSKTAPQGGLFCCRGKYARTQMGERITGYDRSPLILTTAHQCHQKFGDLGVELRSCTALKLLQGVLI